MYFKSNGCEVSQGNSKIGTDTIIINMGSAAKCPSAAKGLCKLGLRCYALKAEKIYPSVAPYRDRQAEYWKKHTAKRIASDLISIIQKRKAVKYIRFNESGDFYKQADITKLDRIAQMVRLATGVVVYGYTARKDLNFKHVTSFLVKGSSNNSGNNGKTIARLKSKILNNSAFLSTGKTDVYNENGELFLVCPGDCRTCAICKVKNHSNVVFPIH